MTLDRLVLGAALVALAIAEDTKDAKDRPKEAEYIKVEVKGLLKHGLVAIGGETTGTTITAKGLTWELDLGRDKSRAQLAEELSGKKALVTGTLEVRKGIEVEQRWIVTVSTLKPAPQEQP
jgi:hypothetical protein